MNDTYIEERSWPDNNLFLKTYVDGSRPVVVRHGITDCPAARWTPDYLCSVIGTKRIKVAVSSAQGVFGYTPDTEDYSVEYIEFAAAVAAMSDLDSATRYIMHIPILETLPELAADISHPPLISEATVPEYLGRPAATPHLWLSPSGAITPLHFDNSNNFLVQVDGSKEVTLYSPQEAAHLYPFSPYARYSYVSQVNYRHPDYEAFPLFREATSVHLRLNRGDVLFIPAFWWHAVETQSMSISLNWWWAITPVQFFAPIVLQQLVASYDLYRLRNVMVRKYGLIDIALFGLTTEQPSWVLALVAAAALELHWRNVLKSSVCEATIPGRLDLMYREIAKDHSMDRLELRTVQDWMRTVATARAANDGGLLRSNVENMVRRINTVIEENRE